MPLNMKYGIVKIFELFIYLFQICWIMSDIGPLENLDNEISKYTKVIFKITNLIFSAVASLAQGYDCWQLSDETKRFAIWHARRWQTFSNLKWLTFIWRTFSPYFYSTKSEKAKWIF